MSQFEALDTLDDVREFVAEGYRAATGGTVPSASRGHQLGFGFQYGPLPLAVAEPTPLIEHAVQLAGDGGITLQELRDVFERLGVERFDRGLALARGAGSIRELRERRLNRTGRLQEQVVLYTGQAAS